MGDLGGGTELPVDEVARFGDHERCRDEWTFVFLEQQQAGVVVCVASVGRSLTDHPLRGCPATRR